MEALEDTNSSVQFKDLIKMEIDIDEKDILDACLKEEEEEEDPLLMLKPIVYTTKLDEMEIVKKGLREFKPKEITDLLISESKPKFTPERMKWSSKSNNTESYFKLSGVVKQMNLKAKIQGHSIYVRNSKLRNQCKPFGIVLEDIKNTILANKQAKALNHISNVSEIQVKLKSLEYSVNKQANEVQIKKEVNVPSWAERRTIVRHVKTDIIDISDTNDTLPETEEKVSTENTTNNTQNKIGKILPSKNATTIELQRKNAEIESPANNTKAIKNNSKKNIKQKAGKKSMTVCRRRQKEPQTSESSEDDITLINFKTKPVASVTISTSIYDKYVLIVLVHNKEQAFVYRVNPTKLITDYFITKVYNEYKLAAMYPKEEKIFNHYCCWFKREEIITKICTRKGYIHIIQKFLSNPHICAPGDCKCCCFINNYSIHSVKSQEQKIKVANKSLAIADSWIRGLLDRNQTLNVGLVGKALNFIPKAQVKEKPIAKQSEKYLESVILWMKYTGSYDNFNNIPELYEIGKNGDVVRSFVIDNNEKCIHIRRIYLLMGLETMKAEFCCWYARDKLLTDLRVKAKMSPTALKLVQVSHFCARNNCKCCCKPRIKSLKAIETLPAILKHTTAYEKSARILTIRFNVKSKSAAKQFKLHNYPNSKKIEKDTDTCTATLSNPTEKGDKDDISTSILSKFKNLKLGVNSDGKLEAVLKAPARNLSIAELKVLSDILAFSAKQIVELRISPEKFCDRINFKFAQAEDEVTREISEISNSKAESPEIEPQKITSPEKPPPSLTPITQPKKLIILAPVTTQNTDSSKAVSHMYSSMTILMEKKSRSYVDSFKAFFENYASSNVVIPEINIFVPAVSSHRKTAPTHQPVLPKIAETFTLSNPTTEVPCIVPGPSDTTGRPDTTGGPDTTGRPVSTITKCKVPVVPSDGPCTPIVVSTASLKTHNTRSSTGTVKRKLPFDNTDKRVRVKTPSELMAQITEEPATTGATTSETSPPPPWPTPIIIKREPHTNIQTIVKSSQSVPVQIKPNQKPNTYLFGNKVVPASNIIVSTALKNVYHVTGSRLTNAVTTVAGTAQQRTGNNTGMQFLTLRPVATANNNSAINKSMLAQILKKPQVQPITLRSGSLPPLVPIKPINISSQSQPRYNGPIPVITSNVKKEKPES